MREDDVPLDGCATRCDSLLFSLLCDGMGGTLVFLRLTIEGWRGMRKIVLLLSTLAAALLLASGVALADHLVNTVFCPTDQDGNCEGTDESDHIYGTNGPD